MQRLGCNVNQPLPGLLPFLANTAAATSTIVFQKPLRSSLHTL